jgi:hypothetical protein
VCKENSWIIFLAVANKPSIFFSSLTSCSECYPHYPIQYELSRNMTTKLYPIQLSNMTLGQFLSSALKMEEAGSFETSVLHTELQAITFQMMTHFLRLLSYQFCKWNFTRDIHTTFL